MYVWWWQAAVQHLSPALRQPLAPTRPSPPFLIGHVPRDPGGAGGPCGRPPTRSIPGPLVRSLGRISTDAFASLLSTSSDSINPYSVSPTPTFHGFQTRGCTRESFNKAQAPK